MRAKQAINDFVVKFANVNGTGSASANSLFAKSIFRTMAAEGRSTHDAIVRLTATVDSLRVRVEELTTELHRPPVASR